MYCFLYCVKRGMFTRQSYPVKESSMTEKSLTENVLSVIVPAYNEGKTISEIIDKILSRPEVFEIIIVDDASIDNTKQMIEKYLGNPKIIFISHEKNCGKGFAVIRGIAEAKGRFVIIQDADLEYSPDDYPTVIEPLLSGKADVVYGSRFMGTPGMVRYFRHEMGNKFLTFLSNVFSNIHLTDMETCYKAFRREVIQNICLESQRFGIEVEITAKVAWARVLRIYEVPISYNPRRYDEGKKITWKDGIDALYRIIKYNLFEDKSKFYRTSWNTITSKNTEN